MKKTLLLSLSLLFAQTSLALNAVEYSECLKSELSRVAKTPNFDKNFVSSALLDGLPEVGAKVDLDIVKAKTATSCEDLVAKYNQGPHTKPLKVTKKKFQITKEVLQLSGFEVAANSLTMDHKVLISVFGETQVPVPNEAETKAAVQYWIQLIMSSNKLNFTAEEIEMGVIRKTYLIRLDKVMSAEQLIAPHL